MPRPRKPMLSAVEKRRAAIQSLSDIIDHAMIDAGIRYDKDLAAKLGMSCGTFSKKKKTGTWTWTDLYDMCQILNPDEGTRARMLGG